MEIGDLLRIVDTDELRPIPGEKSGEAKVFRLETRDALRAEVELREFLDGSKEIRLTNFLSTPPPKYKHLDRNGSMTVQVQADGSWVVLLRALRLGGKKYPTLNRVTWAELSEIAGMDFEQYLLKLGFRTGTWEELNANAGKFKDSLAVSIEEGKASLLLLPWATTRVVALMKRLGKTGLESK